MNGYIIALLIFVAWVGLVYYAHRIKWLERHSMSLFGPAVMWKTRRGRDFIDWLARPRRFWSLYGSLALWICAGAMMTIMLLLLWEATIVSQIAEPPSPELILGIPGVNPVIPIGYGILALAISIVIHELSHGVLTRVGGMRVQSLGLLFLVFPVGAFVEPDEAELKGATRSRRTKVFAAGPASNIIAAMLFLGLFSGVMMSSLEPERDGALAVGVVADSPAALAGISPNSLIVSVGGVSISNASELEARVAHTPGALTNVTYYRGGSLRTVEGVVDGVVVAFATKGFAAYESGMRTGMVLVSLNDTPVGNVETLTQIMSRLRAGQTANVTVMSYDSTAQEFTVNPKIRTVTLSDKWEYYERFYPDSNSESYRGVAYLGGGFLNLGFESADATYYRDILAKPFAGDRGLHDFSRSWLRLIALPFLDLAPVRSPVTDLYHPAGSLAWMPDALFWLVANSLYWIFWINLMLGLTNVLPMIPLDGGYVFSDAFGYVLGRIAPHAPKEKVERWAGQVVAALSLFVFGLILWQIVGPAVL
ncbi:MAG: site-2 protease family protein [Thermoplasmata archaeon]